MPDPASAGRSPRPVTPFVVLGWLNVALLLVLALVVLGAQADAQSGRARGRYTMVAGGANGAASDVVYLVDVVNQEMAAISWDPARKEVRGVGYRSLVADAVSVRQPGAGR